MEKLSDLMPPSWDRGPSHYNKMKLLYIISIILLLSATDPPIGNAAQNRYIWPIGKPESLSGTFCEYRGIKYHCGIDVGCSGKKGYHIMAVDDGWVKTVMYRQWSYGFAVVLQHSDGRSSLYAHMDDFSKSVLASPAIKMHRKDILNRKDFIVEFRHPGILMKKGDLIGYSGESGVGVEHFHFELIDRDGSYLNPIKYGLSIEDTLPPTIVSLKLVPLGPRSHVDGVSEPAAFAARKIRGKANEYWLGPDCISGTGGKIGVMVNAYDSLGTKKRLALYKISLFYDGEKIYEFEFDRLRNGDVYRMGLCYDYDTSTSSDYTHFLYSRSDGRGIIRPGDEGKIHIIKVVCEDAHGNRSEISARIKSERELDKDAYKYEPNVSPGDDSGLESGDGLFKIKFMKDSAVYREMIKIDRREPFSFNNGLSSKSDVYFTSPTNFFIDKPADITMGYRESDFRKVGIYYKNGNGNSLRFVGNAYDEKRRVFHDSVRKLGHYFLLRDDSPPEAKYRYKKKKPVKKYRSINIDVHDRGSGLDLKKVYLKVDGRDAAWDYNFDKERIEILPHNDIWKKGKHLISIQLTDNAGNTSVKYKFRYTIRP
jgi:hypothetical protein